LPIRETSDTCDRDIEYAPPKGTYDPRWFIEGKIDENISQWLSGFFDKRSFREAFSGWAQTVVVGRARLGGIPMGVIASFPPIPPTPIQSSSVSWKLVRFGIQTLHT